MDFSWAVMGPHCTLMLAMMGAEVIKIESSKRLDLIRRPRPHIGQMAPSSFIDLLTNKMSVALDLSDKRAVQLAKEIIAQSDVVVESFRPGVMERLGLGYGTLRQVRPDLVMLSVSTSGSAGPERFAPGYASIFAALSGLSHLTGYEDGPPVELRISMDHTCGQTGALAVLAALNYRWKTGVGQHIDLAARDVLSCLVGDALMDYTMNGRNAARRGNHDSIMAPHNCYRCKGEDKWVSIAVSNQGEWEALSKTIGQPHLVSDGRFSDAYRRWTNQDELDKLIEIWTSTHTPSEVMQLLQAAGVAAVPSFDMAEVTEDLHLKDREAFIEIKHPEKGTGRMVAPPWKLSLTPANSTRWSPELGEHNEHVLGELLGKQQEELASLAVVLQ